MKLYRQVAVKQLARCKGSNWLGRASLFILFALLMLNPIAAQAQSGGQATLAVPDSSRFPTLTTYLDIHDGQGQFVHKLSEADVTILEDGTSIAVQGVSEEQPGVRVIVVINADKALAVRNVNGISRYDTLKTALGTWITAQSSSSANDYSLVTNTGSMITYAPHPADWVSALNTYAPDMRNITENLNGLDQALTMASDATSNAETKKAILFITPAPSDSLVEGITALSDRANQAGVHLFIWMVGGTTDAQSKGATALKNLADATSGAFFVFSGSETLPNIQSYLDPLSYDYKLTYTSKVKTSGAHTIQASIKNSSVDILSAAQKFNINVQAPDPMFVTPPAAIVRQYPTSKAATTNGLVPTQTTLQIMVQFPDGHTRNLVSTSLYVDGKLVAKNTTDPFTSFTWDLTPYQTTGRHILTVEAQDSLGLTGKSSELPMMINVVIPTAEPQGLLQKKNVVPMLAIVLAGCALIMVLLLGFRRRGRGESRTGSGGRRRPTASAPVSYNREEDIESPVISRAERMKQMQQALKDGSAVARLVEISDGTSPLKTLGPLPIGATEVILGSDIIQVTFLVDAPSVNARHARITPGTDGSFVLYDENSVAGTWVNYAPVSREGVHLEHGDLVHIGKVAFRFELINPTRTRKPQVRLLE